jgi:beta-mannosidase
MQTTTVLSARPWKLQGWRPYCWQLRHSLETGGLFVPEHGPYDAVLPGSAHTTLLRHGVIPDWNIGQNSVAVEWVEHRHWEFFTEFAAGELPQDQPLVLEADGLDHAGWILVDTDIAGRFEGALLRHRVDLTRLLGDGRAHRLSIVFDQPPAEQGQVGWTSRSIHYKPRFSYSWDWCPRLVGVGIWDELRLRIGSPDFEIISMAASMEGDNGLVVLEIETPAPSSTVSLKVTVAAEGSDDVCAQAMFHVAAGRASLQVRVPSPALWWPNGTGRPQNLHRVTVSAGSGPVVERRVGFKKIEWFLPPEAPQNASPLGLRINDTTTYLRGANWTPIQLDYMAWDESQYRRLLGLYRDMGCNVLRVWGGAFIEREIFYRLCDELGLLVWQEFPLSSSGIENYAPEDPVSISKLTRIARDYIERRRHHACKLLWCGGNELQTKPVKVWGHQTPLDLAHPALAALAAVVAEEDPGVAFLPTSPSGPVFYAKEENFGLGQGDHYHVHGPWNHEGPLAGWHRYWNNDDSYLRSEIGFPSASSAEVIRRHAGCEPWPPTLDNAAWRHTSTWWLQWTDFQAENPGVDDLDSYVAWSQNRQAEALETAARSCLNRARDGRHGGILFWMGHDAFPCMSNTAIIGFDGIPKPAYHRIKAVFRSLDS